MLSPVTLLSVTGKIVFINGQSEECFVGWTTGMNHRKESKMCTF